MGLKSKPVHLIVYESKGLITIRRGDSCGPPKNNFPFGDLPLSKEEIPEAEQKIEDF